MALIQAQVNVRLMAKMATSATKMRRQVSAPRVEALHARARAVFGNAEKGDRWWHGSVPALDGRSPAECAQTLAGWIEVKTILWRVATGVYS